MHTSLHSFIITLAHTNSPTKKKTFFPDENNDEQKLPIICFKLTSKTLFFNTKSNYDGKSKQKC